MKAAHADRIERWRGVQRVLAVRLDNLGEVLMTTPAIAALRETLTRAHVTLLTSPAAGAAGVHLDFVDAVWPFAAPWVKRTEVADEGGGIGAAEAVLAGKLRAAHFDAAVIFTDCTQSALPAALLCRLAGIPLRLGFSRENPYALLPDWVAETDVVGGNVRHEVQRQLHLVGSVGMRTADDRLRFAVRDADRRRVAERLSAHGVDASRYVVLHPGATAASRRWPAERFGSTGRLLAEHGLHVVFSGDAADATRVAAARLAMQHPSVSLAGELTLGELAALIEGARVLVANNSAPAHLAAAVGTPVVVLYALTNPQHTPWRTASRVLYHDVPCRWCLKSTCPERHHDCLMRVGARDAADAALALLGSPRAAAPAPARTLPPLVACPS